EMRRQRGCDIRLGLDRMDRIVFTAEDQSWTLDAVKIPEHVERAGFAARSCEPMQHLRPADRAARRVRIARNARVQRHGELSPGLERSLIGMPLNLQEAAARQRSHLWPSEAFEQRHAPV